jgi:hypothetical protein
MAITPMQLPSPKAFDPTQMEAANLRLFDDPQTSALAGAIMSNLMTNREYAGDQYSNAVAGQQDYYNRALEYQNRAGLRDDLAKFGNQNMPHGLTLATGIPEFREFLNNMGPAFGTIQQQAFQNAQAGTAKTGMEAANLGYQTGLPISPQTYEGLTGVPVGVGVPSKMQEIALENQGRAASASGGKEKMIKLTYSLPGHSPTTFEVPESVFIAGGQPAAEAYIENKYKVPAPTRPKAPPRVEKGGTPPPAAGATNLPPAPQAAPAKKPAATPTPQPSARAPAPPPREGLPPTTQPVAPASEWMAGINRALQSVSDAMSRLGR